MTDTGADRLDEVLGLACAVCDTMLLHAPDYDAEPVWPAVGALFEWTEQRTGRRGGYGPVNDLCEAGVLDGDDPRVGLLRAALAVCEQFEMIRSASTGEYPRDMERCGKLLERYLELRAVT